MERCVKSLGLGDVAVPYPPPAPPVAQSLMGPIRQEVAAKILSGELLSVVSAEKRRTIANWGVLSAVLF